MSEGVRMSNGKRREERMGEEKMKQKEGGGVKDTGKMGAAREEKKKKMKKEERDGERQRGRKAVGERFIRGDGRSGRGGKERNRKI